MSYLIKPTRRQFLETASGGFAATALAGIWNDVQAASRDPLAARSGHYVPQADRVIFVYATGGVSHVDTFDYKPQLTVDHGKSITASRWLNKSGEFKRYLIQSRWGFNRYGQNGVWVSGLFPHLSLIHI